MAQLLSNHPIEDSVSQPVNGSATFKSPIRLFTGHSTHSSARVKIFSQSQVNSVSMIEVPFCFTCKIPYSSVNVNWIRTTIFGFWTAKTCSKFQLNRNIR